MKRRILSGGIAQESHSFNPVLTKRERFTITEGDAAVQKARGTNSTLGGVVDAAEAEGCEVLVPVLYRAQSGGPVEDAVFGEALERMADAARRGDFDAIVLPLHGGMLTPKLADPEGVLIQALRAAVGPSVPITAAFDLHSYITSDTLDGLDFLAAYLTNPHADQAATARRAYAAAAAMLDDTLDPVGVSVRFPLLTLGHDRTDESPLQELHARAKAAVDAGTAYDVSIFNAQQFLDVPGVGQTVLAYGNGQPPEALAMELASGLWEQRAKLREVYASVESCLDRLASTTRPLILGDQGDRVAGGGYGDSTFILNALLARKLDMSAAIPITDPDAVERCAAAGVGSEIELTFGGRITQISPPVRAKGIVVAAGQNQPVTYDGPSDQGTKTALAGFAVFAIGQIRVLLTTEPYSYIDPGYFRAAGIDPASTSLIVTRSSYHFTLNFARIGDTVTVETPGITSYDVEKLPWRLARPFYPLDDIGFAPDTGVHRSASGIKRKGLGATSPSG